MQDGMVMAPGGGQSLRYSGEAQQRERSTRETGVLEGLFRETESLTKSAEMLRERVALLATRVVGVEPPRPEAAGNNAGGAGSQLEAFLHEIRRLGRVLGEVGEQVGRLERL